MVGRFGSPALDAALTVTSWKDRLLGANRVVEAPMVATWYATGNNVGVATDTIRRICHIRLESSEERPEMREVSGCRPTVCANPKIPGATTPAKAAPIAGRSGPPSPPGVAAPVHSASPDGNRRESRRVRRAEHH